MKPCPFCGAEAKVVSPPTGSYVVACQGTDCGAVMRAWDMDNAKQHAMVVERWERRAETEEEHQRRLDSIEEANPEDM